MLPGRWCLRLDPGTRRVDHGRVLIGGSPLRLLRLNAAAGRLVDQFADGDAIGSGAGAQVLARRLLDAGIAHPRPSPTTRTPLDVTVVVPVFGTPDELRPTLAALGRVGRLIVVDDASPDPGIADVAQDHGGEVVRHDVNRGPAAARNTGWRRATTELVVFIDTGCVPSPDWLDDLLPHLDDPRVVAVAPRITTTVAATLPRALAAYERARPSLDRGPAEANVRPRSQVSFVPAATLLVRLDALEAVSGFEETMRMGEDVDLVWRLVGRGGTVRYAPTTSVAHTSRPSALAWLCQRYAYGTSAAALARRHGSAVAPLAISPWTALAWGLAGAGAPLAGLAVAGGSTALLAPKLEHLEHPWQESAHLAGLGHLYGGRVIADALRRPWWPFAAVAALFSRRARIAVAVAAMAPPLLEWWQQRPPLDPIRWIGLRLVDDIAYGTGVWAGCGRERSVVALRPDLTSWPGRKAAVEPAVNT